MEVKSEFKENEFVTWGGGINEFLWICSGVDRRIVRQCPTEYAKYAGIGGTILFTALMAIISSGYAVNFVFKNLTCSVCFGIFWGLLIFNLDRFIVNTMYSDGKVTISWQELKSGLPRIIMAIFLGIVISTPLEMKIFEDQIESQIAQDNSCQNNNAKNIADTEYNNLIKQRDTIEAKLSAANKAVTAEAAGESSSGQVGFGTRFKAKKELVKEYEAELDRWNNENKVKLAQIVTNQKKAQIAIDNQEKIVRDKLKKDGFCVRYAAFHNVTKKSTSLNIVSWIVMLLFVIIETVPTFFKMMIASGPYDDYLRAERYHARALSDKRIEDLHDQIHTALAISSDENKKRLETEITANEQIVKKIAMAQSEIIETAIEKWKAEELKKVLENPAIYLKIDKTSDLLSEGEVDETI